MKECKEIPLTNEQVAYLSGLLSGLDALPDGAWIETCKDRIAACGAFDGLDEHDVWLAWIKQCGEFAEKG